MTNGRGVNPYGEPSRGPSTLGELAALRARAETAERAQSELATMLLTGRQPNGVTQRAEPEP